jgi:aminoglycoside phosphotransferase (APT) family kinase protein
MVASVSKTRVRKDEAAAIIEAAFGSASMLVSFSECGLSNSTTCILKVAPPPGVRVLRYEHDIITTEVDALRLVRARTQLPVPAVLAWDASCKLVPSPYFVMEHCSGTLLSDLRPTLDADAQAAIDAQLARFLASLHSITAPAFGRPDPSALHDATWSAGFARLIADLLADADDAGVELPIPYREIVELVEGNAAQLDAVTTPRLVHWDLWDLNVFVDPETLAVTGLIDFERVLWGDPLMEAQFVGRRAGDAVVEAYANPLFEQAHAVERRRLYDLYLYLVMVVECSYRNYPTDDIEQLARPCLAAVIEEIRTA